MKSYLPKNTNITENILLPVKVPTEILELSKDNINEYTEISVGQWDLEFNPVYSIKQASIMYQAKELRQIRNVFARSPLGKCSICVTFNEDIKVNTKTMNVEYGKVNMRIQYYEFHNYYMDQYNESESSLSFLIHSFLMLVDKELAYNEDIESIMKEFRDLKTILCCIRTLLSSSGFDKEQTISMKKMGFELSGKLFILNTTPYDHWKKGIKQEYDEVRKLLNKKAKKENVSLDIEHYLSMFNNEISNK